MSLAALRKNMSTNLSRIKQQVESEEKGSKSVDERFWKPTFDKEKGTGTATIRFMPAPNGEDMSYVKMYSHSFQGPTGKYYIENSLSTIGKRDSISNLNYRLWNSGIESDKSVSSKQKRKTNYYANVLVINDPAKPENNGKVFLYQFGPKIHDMLQSAMFPEFEDEDSKAIDPFSPWDGADFVIRMTGTTMQGAKGPITVPSYEKSSFRPASELGDDEKIETLWKQCHSLQAIIAPDKFKTPEELEKRLFEVLGPRVGSGIETIEGWSAPAQEVKAAPIKQAAKEEFEDVPDFAVETKKVSKPKEEDDDLEFLKSLID
ncbi:MAG: single-stranded DNA-binding protein [Pseudomonadota bacterium]|nr:single-stranded DNA-binding protein [Pseudomonadota bacterium]